MSVAGLRKPAIEAQETESCNLIAGTSIPTEFAMYNLILLWLITGLAVAVPCFAVATKKLAPFKDYYFCLIYSQMILYLHLAPTLWAPFVDREMADTYVEIQAACLFLFEIPFLVVYIRGRSQFVRMRKHHNLKIQRTAAPQADRENNLRIRQTPLLLLVGFFDVLALLYLWVTFSTNTFFFRFGGEGNLSALFAFSDFEFYVFRLFQLSAPFLMCIAVSSLFFLRRGTLRVQLSLLMIIPSSIFMLNQIVNSRSGSLMTMALLFGVLLYVGKIPLPAYKTVVLIALGVLGVGYLLRVTDNVRAAYLDAPEGLKLEMFNPFVRLGGVVGVSSEDLRSRLNGIDLMALMTPSAEREGFAHGEAWRGAAILVVSQIFGRSALEEMKATFSGSPKLYLMRRYTDLTLIDYEACWLTDVYGNFGFVAFPFLAILTGYCWVWMTRAVSWSPTPVSLVLGLYFIGNLVAFEGEFAGLVTGWIRPLPILVLVLVLNPFAARARRVPALSLGWRARFEGSANRAKAGVDT